MDIPEHKQYQQLYRSVVTENPDDFSKMPMIVWPLNLKDAQEYFLASNFPLVYPAKSMAVAVIYALLLEETYAINPFDTLNDPDLFLGQDPYFVTYDAQPVMYDQLLEWVLEQPNWKESGWAKQTVEYFRLECTEVGIQEVLNTI